MYDQILFPTDGSEPAESVLDYAIQIAAQHDATLHVLNVADTNRDSLTSIRGEVIDVLEQDGRDIVDAAAARVRDRGVSPVPEVRQGDPSRTIVEYSAQSEIGLIVMPTHGRRGLQRFLLGSVTERVINTAAMPVVAVNPGDDRAITYPCERILVPTDGSSGGERALSEGIALAKATGATLHVLHVVETGALGLDARSAVKEDELAERANEIVAAATERARAASLEGVESTVASGDPSREIRRYVEEHAIDLAVVGTHGQTDFSRYVLGGVSSKIVRTSPVPIMWVREPDSNDAPSDDSTAGPSSESN